MATDTSRVRGRQVVIAIHMALRALQCRMRARQREACGRVVERRIPPRRSRVALLAGLREIRLHVIRIRGPLEIFQVATDTSRVRGRQVVIAIHVARRALQRGVSARQRESRGRVIECRRRPVRRGMTLLTSLRES